MTKDTILREEDLVSLPKAIKNYISYTKALGKEKLVKVKIEQIGEFRLNNKWLKLRAKQYFNFIKKSFVWKAKIGFIKVVDQYVNEKGLLKAKLFGFIPLIRAEGTEIDQGEVIRLLSEMIWFPTSLLSDFVVWQEVNNNIAKAIVSYRDKKATAYFHFEDNGRLIAVKAKRYMEKNGKYFLKDWEASNFEYADFKTGYIPYKATVSWKLGVEDFCYCKVQLTDIIVNY